MEYGPYIKFKLINLNHKFENYLFIFSQEFTILQIERERADLSVQVIQLSERLEEAEGGAESQVS